MGIQECGEVARVFILGAEAATTFVYMGGSFVFKLFNIIGSKFVKVPDVSVWQVPSKVTIDNEGI